MLSRVDWRYLTVLLNKQPGQTWLIGDESTSWTGSCCTTPTARMGYREVSSPTSSCVGCRCGVMKSDDIRCSKMNGRSLSTAKPGYRSNSWLTRIVCRWPIPDFQVVSATVLAGFAHMKRAESHFNQLTWRDFQSPIAVRCLVVRTRKIWARHSATCVVKSTSTSPDL